MSSKTTSGFNSPTLSTACLRHSLCRTRTIYAIRVAPEGQCAQPRHHQRREFRTSVGLLKDCAVSHARVHSLYTTVPVTLFKVSPAGTGVGAVRVTALDCGWSGNGSLCASQSPMSPLVL